MHKLYTFCLILFITILAGSSSYAIELMPTPIQDQMQSTILFAADSWKIDDNDSPTQNKTLNGDADEKKSVVKAAFYSALLPGLGEHYVGHRTKSKVFFATEALIWISYLTFHTYGEWKKDDMIRYAADNASASLEGKDDEFYDWVGFYDSSEDFNSLGRVTDPDRSYLIGGDNYWQWTTEENRENFRTIKNSSRTAFDRAGFMIVAAVGNRIISVIDAIRDAKRANREKSIDISADNSLNYKFTIDPLSYNKQISLTLFTPF